MTSRRDFIRIVPLAGAALLTSRTSFGADAPKLELKDAQAVALGYVPDATKADKAKFTNYAAGHECGNCHQFQGKAGDAFGPCLIFGGKQVSSKGWCSAWVKKA
ncbi:MAG: high-potential iron-sulfur protein [Burkholderiales bacterium]